ncbi:molybdenum cofactor guanylyltransferase [Virgibacillus kimchii]
MTVIGIILAGGKSSRMGENKALLPLGNQKVVEHIYDELFSLSDKVVVVANDPSLYSFLKCDIVSDRFREKGPLAGLETAFFHKKADAYIVSACDTPLINKDVYQHLFSNLHNYDAAVPVFDEQTHPLSGIYRRSALQAVQQQLDKGELKVKSFFENIYVNYVDEFDGISEKTLHRHFFNMNTRSDYAEIKLLYDLSN